MYDIALMSPPSRMINHYRPPLSLIYLGGYLNFKGLSVKIIDYTMDRVVRDKEFYANSNSMLKSIEIEMLNQLYKVDTNWVGVSCYSDEIQEVLCLIKKIRKMKPEVKIVVGGIHAMLSPEDFKLVADAVIVGEGEVALFETITQNLRGKIKAEIHDIDGISHPNYELVDMEYYTNANPYAIRGVFLRTAYILASRGCPSQCAFCVAPRLRDYFGVGRYRNPYNIMLEVNHLKTKYHIDGVYFIDDTLTTNKKMFLELCGYLKKLNIIWGCSSRIPTLDEQMISAMAETGCIQIDFGVERGSDQALLAIKKHQSIEQIKNVFELCKQYKIRTLANMLVNVPGEKLTDYDDVRKLLDEIKPSITSINVYRKYLGTDLPGKKPEHWVNPWATVMTKTHTDIIGNFLFHLKWKYWKVIFRSKKKGNYLKQLYILIKELANQLW